MAVPILCLVPDHDNPSKYGHFYFFHFGIPKLIEKVGYEPIVLAGDDATFENFREVMKERAPPIIFTVGGHGAWNLLSVQHKKAVLAVPGVAKELSPTKKVVVKNGNDQVLQGRSVYTISCHVTRGLGRKAVKDGCLVFAGYRRSFVWLVNPNIPMEEDDKASVFFDSAFEFNRTLLRGRTFQEAYENTLGMFKKAAEQTSDGDVERYLLWNAKILEVLGHSNLRLKDYMQSIS